MVPIKYPKESSLYIFPHGHPNGMTHTLAKQMLTLWYSHPIIYLLWYRWWIPSLLHEDDRENLIYILGGDQITAPYWVEFSKFHPVQFVAILLLIIRPYQIVVKCFTTIVKKVNRIFKHLSTKNGTSNPPIDNEFT